MDVLHRFKLLNGLQTLLLLSLVKSFTAKGIYLKAFRSGFEPESPVTIHINVLLSYF
jgi:hypothetical protein